jgi:hypothetical protein
MAKFKKGDAVAQIVQPIQGVVDSFQVDQETGSLLVHISWVDADGGEHGKFFLEEDLTAVE